MLQVFSETPPLLAVPAAATCQCHRPIDFLLTSFSSGTDGIAFGGRWQRSIKVFTLAVIDV